MRKLKQKNNASLFENISDKKESQYILRLYIAGTTPQSVRAITNLKKICEDYLKDAYTLAIIDIYQQPQLAEGDQIIAVPTLIKKLPYPLKRLIGDMSHKDHVLIGLDLLGKQ